MQTSLTGKPSKPPAWLSVSIDGQNEAEINKLLSECADRI